MLHARGRHLMAPALRFPPPQGLLSDGNSTDLAAHMGEAPNQRVALLRDVYHSTRKALIQGMDGHLPVDEDVFLGMGCLPQSGPQDGIGAKGDDHGMFNMRLNTASGPGRLGLSFQGQWKGGRAGPVIETLSTLLS